MDFVIIQKNCLLYNILVAFILIVFPASHANDIETQLTKISALVELVSKFALAIEQKPSESEQAASACKMVLKQLMECYKKIGRSQNSISGLAGVTICTQAELARFSLKENLQAFTQRLEETPSFFDCFEQDRDYDVAIVWSFFIVKCMYIELDDPLSTIFDGSSSNNKSELKLFFTLINQNSLAIDYLIRTLRPAARSNNSSENE